MDKNFEGGERLGLRGVYDRAAEGVPAATEAASAFPGESALGKPAMDDSPGNDAHIQRATLTGRRRARAGR